MDIAICQHQFARPHAFVRGVVGRIHMVGVSSSFVVESQRHFHTDGNGHARLPDVPPTALSE
ncbi:hypothetical protein [Phaeobacter sp. HF9A]|uniref:hypothetical protein n=1 Tax=Phaeobacter sp. HF9A TaxID=2721561 RepID=UPI0014314BA6|nr:hypothetical protein [Phaeobacter sp. HF9A]NIZ12769.1 hypothetical protein [Phaeobacter sp. HF9A]